MPPKAFLLFMAVMQYMCSTVFVLVSASTCLVLVCSLDWNLFLHLQETVKEKDQSLRKYVQEIDSLTFRNQQVLEGMLRL